MDSKVFCILEQGKFINDKLTLKHKEQFNTSFSDFYRLNWHTPEDPHAQFHVPNITLSEGKNLLYEKVPKIYQYYIFIDDDVDLETVDGTSVAEKIRDILCEYNPLNGTFYRNESNRWGCWHIDRLTKLHAVHNRAVFPICGFDIDCSIYHWSYIKEVFPIRYHGCYKCLGYTQYICSRLYPHKQLMFNDIRITNTRRGTHKEELNLPQANNALNITKLFLKDLHNIPINRDAKYALNNSSIIAHLNERVYLNEIDKTEIIFTKEDLNKICNW